MYIELDAAMEAATFFMFVIFLVVLVADDELKG